MTFVRSNLLGEANGILQTLRSEQSEKSTGTRILRISRCVSWRLGIDEVCADSKSSEIVTRRKPRALQIGDDCRQRVRSATNADMHENDGAVEVAVALAGDAIDQKLGSLYWFHSVLAIERPVDRSVTEIPRDFQNPLIAYAVGSAESRPRRLTRNLNNSALSPHDLIADDLIGLLGQIEMTPGMISGFVTMFCDLRSAVGVVMHKSSRDKEGAVYVRVRQGCDQIVKTFGLGSCIEGERDLLLAARAAIDLAKLPHLLVLAGAILLGHFRFRVDGVKKRRRTDRKQNQCDCTDQSDQRSGAALFGNPSLRPIGFTDAGASIGQLR